MAPRTEADPTPDPPSRRELHLDPTDWYWAPWRELDPLEATVPDFDLEDALRRLEKVKVESGWSFDYGPAEIAPVLCGAEAYFWFEAMCALQRRGATPRSVVAKLAGKKFSGKPSANQVVDRFLATGWNSYAEEVAIPLANLLGRSGFADFLCQHLDFAGERWQRAETIGLFAHACRRYVIPYLSLEERGYVRDMVRPLLDPSSVSSDSYDALPMPYYLAAMVGLHDEVAEVVHAWAEDRYPANLSWETDQYQRPQMLVFGLGDPEEVAAQMRRLRLRLNTGDYVRAWLAHTEVSGLGYLRDTITGETNRGIAANLAEVFSLVEAPEAAEPMLELKLKSKAPQVARRWLDEYPESAIAGLVATANGRTALADAAVEVLRGYLRDGHGELLRRQVEQAGIAASARVVRDVVDFQQKVYEHFDESTTPAWLDDALASAGRRRRKLPDWAAVRPSDPIVVGEHSLNDEQVDAVIAVLVSAKPKQPVPPLMAALREHANPDSLDAFAWSLFQTWMEEGAPSKEKWALLGVGFLGGDPCALKLAPLLRAWPGESQHARAVIGLECLRGIGTDTALMQLHGIAQKLKYKGLKKKAAELMEAIAQDRGLTRPELEDRIVPDCGLDENGSLTFDFGPRQFTFVLGAGLKPKVRDGAGKVRANLPKPGVRDDTAKAEEAVARWKLLKKKLREVLKIQAPRLEQAMITGRRWPVTDYDRFFVRHPLMTHLARLVVWGGYDETGQPAGTFRLTEEADFADAEDEPCEIDGFAGVGIVHPLHLCDEERGTWGEVWSDYEIIPPFEQLGRPFFHLEPTEKGAKQIERFADAEIPATSLVGTLERLAWARGVPQDAGVFFEHTKPFYGAGVTAVVQYVPGVPVGYFEGWDDQSIERCFFVPGIYTPEMYPDHKRSVRLDQVDPVALSEVLADLNVLASKRTN